MQITDLIPKYITACCIMYNMCLNNDIIDIPIIVNELNIMQEAEIKDNAAYREGIEKRNAIMYYKMFK